MVNKVKDVNHLVNKLIQTTDIITRFQVNQYTNVLQVVVSNTHILKLIVMNVNNHANTLKSFQLPMFLELHQDVFQNKIVVHTISKKLFQLQ